MHRQHLSEGYNYNIPTFFLSNVTLPSHLLPSHLCLHSIQQQEMKVEVSPCHRLAPAWRTSAQRHSSSVTGLKAHATTLLTRTASGSPP